MDRDENGLPRLHYAPHDSACNFTVECTDDLGDPESWQPTLLDFTGDDAGQVANLPPPGNGPMFYRIHVSPATDPL